MYETYSIKEKIKLFYIILIPILITQVSMNLMNFFNTIMSGRAGPVDLAGVAIGSSIWFPIFTGINGILIAITPIIAHLLGSKDHESVPEKVQQGIYLSAGLGLLVMVIGFFVLEPILNAMKLEAGVHRVAKYYLLNLGVGIIPLFIFNTLRNFIDALGKTRTSMTIILISLPINLFFNYVFVFGKFGVPAFGGIGSGIATAITYWLICVIAFVIVHHLVPFKQYHIFRNWRTPSLKTWWEQLKIGVPIGFAIFFESSIFAAVTIMMSSYSTFTIAAHQAAINFNSLLYMVPLSIGLALTIAIGFEVGGKRYKDARTYGYIGIGSGLSIGLFAAIGLYLFKDTIASFYSTNPEVIYLTVQFIHFAIFLQLADAFLAPLQGALRGYKDVNVTLIMSFVSFWIIGLPSGWLLANFTPLEPLGYWLGLIIGLGCGGMTLFIRLLYIHRKYKHDDVQPVQTLEVQNIH